MTLPVFLHDNPAETVGAEVLLDGPEGHHAAAVKRLRVGEQCVLTDGHGLEVTAEVTSVEKASLTTRVVRAERLPRPSPRLRVVQAIPKGERAELAVGVLTEIGADVIVPWAASRCVAVWKGERAAKSLGRWRTTAREAAKQARRAWHPQVTEQATTNDVAALIADADLALVLHEEASGGLPAVEKARDIVLVVGPEGGISPEELSAFVAAGGRPVRLGSEVLRTSTAGVAAAAAVLSGTTRWQ